MSDLRGELRILYDELNSRNAETKKDALKKVIVYMSVGKDVSAIFQSVIKCIELPDIEIKKLIYLYIINYSRTHPNDAIMIIHQFIKVYFFLLNPPKGHRRQIKPSHPCFGHPHNGLPARARPERLSDKPLKGWS
jgi:hypothetical protein